MATVAAAGRRAATPLLLSAAAATSTPVASAPTTQLVCATAHRAANPLLLGAAAATSTPVASTAVATTTKVLSATAHRAANPLLLGAPAPLLRRAGILGSHTPANLHRSTTQINPFSTSTIGNRSSLRAPIHLATGGSLIASRGMSGQPQAALSPGLRRELQRMEEASVARHRELANSFAEFQAGMRKEHAMLQVNKANRSFSNAKVVWRVVWGSLAAAALGIWYALHTKSIWIRDFKISALLLLTEVLFKLKLDLEDEVKKTVREELNKKDMQ